MWADAKWSFIILELIFVQFHYGHSNKQSLPVFHPALFSVVDCGLGQWEDVVIISLDPSALILPD